MKAFHQELQNDPEGSEKGKSMNECSEPTLAVLMTCFNRREKTLKTLESLSRQKAEVRRKMKVILVDDASNDGTAKAIEDQFPKVHLIRGSGSLYWNGGMRVAFERALRENFDYYLWLNDDTELFDNAIDVLLFASGELQAAGVCAIVTGSTRDPQTGMRSYGGISRRWGWNGVRDTPVEPQLDRAVPCNTMNGNCTLIPKAVASVLGNLDNRFHHHYGDYDYGFRAGRMGISVYVAPGFVGLCSRNSLSGTWRDRGAPLQRRWRHLLSPKGVPPAEWLVAARRHYGYLWPFYFISPYLKALRIR